jgi:hypothetical protein
LDIQKVDVMKRFEYKVPGGKLLRAKLDTDANGRITFLQLTGDFFMEPETDLEELETRIISMSVDPLQIQGQVVSFFTSRKTRIAGACPADFAYVIIQALNA